MVRTTLTMVEEYLVAFIVYSMDVTLAAVSTQLLMMTGRWKWLRVRGVKTLKYP